MTISAQKNSVPEVKILAGDCLSVLRGMPDNSINCCVTSPPYWGLRDYGCDGQIGMENTFEEYIARLVDVFREVRRVLTDDGTCWINIGDCYAGSWGAQGKQGQTGQMANRSIVSARQIAASQRRTNGTGSINRAPGLKPKDLVGIPWRLAFALQLDGWWLRQDIIWHKPNPMPESVRDRCTKSHEYIFLLSKSERYFWNGDDIKETSKCGGEVRDFTGNKKCNTADPILQRTLPRGRKMVVGDMRNRRSVWTVATNPYSEAHFATYPPALIRPCIRAGCPVSGIVLDPFGGSGTTGMVALEEGRSAVLIEINSKYINLAKIRTSVTCGLGL